jgi:hypothetical protein
MSTTPGLTGTPVNRTLLSLLVLFLVGLTGCDESPLTADAQPAAASAEAEKESPRSFAVSGTGVHYFTTAVIHSQTPTETGMVQRSSDVVQLSGDLDGYVLYHPTSVFDFAAGTLTNTGTQVFSGTVAGSGPVILHDDTFVFESDLETGATTGTVHFGRSLDAPRRSGWFECDLDVVGTGLTPAGDGAVDYAGTCVARGSFSQDGTQ